MSIFVEIRDCNFNRQEQKIEIVPRIPEGVWRDEGRDSFEKGTKSERRMPRLSGGEEGRGKLRKAAGICKQDLIRGHPNGATHMAEGHVPPRGGANPGN